MNSRFLFGSHAYLYLFSENKNQNIYKLLSKKEKKIKKHQFLQNSSYFIIIILEISHG